jgi:ATP-dependent DNA helicase RecG
MAPTEILAQQHFESFIEFFRPSTSSGQAISTIQIGLITSSGCKKFPSKVNPNGWTDISRPQLLKWVANGEIPILIGTHALIQKSVKFKHLAYVIIDEQHRFGTNQRALLARKTDVPDKNVWRMPHLLSMTATPIPRTLALTVYGDLDLTLLDEQPKGRKEIKTHIVTPSERGKTYAHIQTLIDEGRQIFVVCPRIDEPDPAKETALRAKSVVEEAQRLKRDVFPKTRIGIVHGKMKPQEKEDMMKNFAEGAIDILVATSVIEVGVNVPNATAIIIEGADRFGLAQLHQLRGRVLRSSFQAYCYLFTDSKSASTNDRLKALAQSANGFELAERDLELRGSGELYGGRQWGITDVGMEALRNLKMVEAARNEARTLIKTDPELTNTPLLKDAVRERISVHFE